MNFDLIFAIMFYAALLIFFLKNREKFELQGGIFALYRTKLGLKLMDKIARKNSKLLNLLSYVSVFVGFTGMVFIMYTLLQGVYKLIFIPGSQPVVAPVLPGISISPELPVLNFWHWIIGIFIVAVVHEFAHGVYARLYKIDVKSSGFAFLGPILAAFVEPDEKKMKKIEKKKQLAIISAGPFVNIVLGFLIILFFTFIFAPLQTNLLEVNGVNIVQVEKGSPAELSGIKTGVIIKEVNNIKVNSQDQLINLIKNSDKNDVLKFSTDKESFYVKPDLSSGEPKVGISVSNSLGVKRGLPQFLLPVLLWFNLLFFWLWVINLGIGLFNLLPLGPIDGGKMLYTALLGITTNKKALKIFKRVTIFNLSLIIINLLPWLFKLVKWIFGF